MLGYAHRYGVGDVYLLYPHHDRVGADAGLQRSFRIPRNVDSHAAEGGVQCIHVATVDLADLGKVSGQLQSILEKATDLRSDVVELVA